RSLTRRSDGFICVCESDFTKALRAGIIEGSRTEIIPCGIETSRFREHAEKNELRNLHRIDPELFVFGNVGRLHIQKGQEYLLRAFHSILPQIPGSELWIVGEGELRPLLEETIRGLGLGG